MSFVKTKWTGDDYAEFVAYLISLGEDSFKNFNDRIVPDAIEPIGIRIPVLRALAKEIAGGDFRGFLKVACGRCHEEIILRGLVMTYAKTDYDEMLSNMKEFAPLITNWAICDTVSFKGIKKHKERFWQDAGWFLDNENPWIVRYGLNALMTNYLDGEYIDRVLEITNGVKVDFYYVKMMQAWLYATAVAKCRDKTMAFLLSTPLDGEIAKMTVGKMRDSYRVSDEDTHSVKEFQLKM